MPKEVVEETKNAGGALQSVVSSALTAVKEVFYPTVHAKE